MRYQTNQHTQPGHTCPDPMAILYQLGEALGVAKIEVQAAVTAVGEDPERVARYLKDRLGIG